MSDPAMKIRRDLELLQKIDDPEIPKVSASIKHYISIAQRLYKPLPALKKEWLKK